MGLDVSHGAFSGGYIRFNRFRSHIIESIGGSSPPHSNSKLDSCKWYWRNDGQTDQEYNKKNYYGLYVFMCQSDCDGEILPADVKLVKRDLERILPFITEYAKQKNQSDLVKTTETFILGCEDAIKKGDSLVFY